MTVSEMNVKNVRCVTGEIYESEDIENNNPFLTFPSLSLFIYFNKTLTADSFTE